MKTQICIHAILTIVLTSGITLACAAETQENLRDRLLSESQSYTLGRNPFAPARLAGDIQENVILKLQGIFWDEVNPKAIINDEIVSSGMSNNNYSIVEIKRKEVVLRIYNEALGPSGELISLVLPDYTQ